MRLSVEILQLNIPFKNQSPESIVWHYLQMDGQTTGQTHDDGMYHAQHSIAR